MAEGTKREAALGFDVKVAIVTGGGAADDGIGNGRAAAVSSISLRRTGAVSCRSMSTACSWRRVARSRR